jgi:hypothetical protein
MKSKPMETREEAVDISEADAAMEDVVKDENAAENAPAIGMRCEGSLVLLRRMEQYGISLDQAKIRKSQSVNKWWVRSGEEVTGPHEFREIVTALSDGISPIQILHESQREDETAPWVKLSYRPQWQDPTIALVWGVGMWIVAVVFLYVVALSATPPAWHRVVEVILLLGAGVLSFLKWKKKGSQKVKSTEADGPVGDREAINSINDPLGETSDLSKTSDI